MHRQVHCFTYIQRNLNYMNYNAKSTGMVNNNCKSETDHHGLAEFPAPVGSQEVVATPTNAHC